MYELLEERQHYATDGNMMNIHNPVNSAASDINIETNYASPTKV